MQEKVNTTTLIFHEGVGLVLKEKTIKTRENIYKGIKFCYIYYKLNKDAMREKKLIKKR